MGVQVRLTDGALPKMIDRPTTEGAGARVVFDGIVRPTEDGREIEGLGYEAYRPMAERQLERIGDELVAKHGLLLMDVEHSIGFVANFECSFRLIIDSEHRKEGLKAMGEFIDLLKQDVPIWKSTQQIDPKRNL